MNVEFLKGHIEEIPLPDNCVDDHLQLAINLSGDKNRVFAEALRVLKPVAGIPVSDVSAEPPLPEELATITALYRLHQRSAQWRRMRRGLTAAGFDDVSVDPTQVFERPVGRTGIRTDESASRPGRERGHRQPDGVIRSAAIRAVKPGGEPRPAVSVIQVVEPALCCDTGVCGPDVD